MATQLTPGKYTAKVKDYGIGSTKSGAPMAQILFDIVDSDGVHHEKIWFGSLKEGKAQEFTVDALLVCGLRGMDLNEFAKGVTGNALDTNKEVQVTLDNETYEGKTKLKIKWVNEAGGAGFKDKMSQADAVKVLGGVNISGTIAARRAEKGYTDKPRETKPVDFGDIPF